MIKGVEQQAVEQQAEHGAESLLNEAYALNQVADYLESLAGPDPGEFLRIEILEDAAFVLHRLAQDSEGRDQYAEKLRNQASRLLHVVSDLGGGQWEPQGGYLLAVELRRREALIMKSRPLNARSTTHKSMLLVADLLRREASTLRSVAADCESDNDDPKSERLESEPARLRSVATRLEAKEREYANKGELFVAKCLKNQAFVLRSEAGALQSALATKALIEANAIDSTNIELVREPLDSEVILDTGVWLASTATGISFAAARSGKGRLGTEDGWHAYALGKPYFVGELGIYRTLEDAMAACRGFASEFGRRTDGIVRQMDRDDAEVGTSQDNLTKPFAAPLEWRWIGRHLWMAPTTISVSFSVYKAAASDQFHSYVCDCGQITDLGSRERLLDAKADCQIWYSQHQMATTKSASS